MSWRRKGKAAVGCSVLGPDRALLGHWLLESLLWWKNVVFSCARAFWLMFHVHWSNVARHTFIHCRAVRQLFLVTTATSGSVQQPVRTRISPTQWAVADLYRTLRYTGVPFSALMLLVGCQEECNVLYRGNVNVEFKVTLHEQVRYGDTLQY